MVTNGHADTKKDLRNEKLTSQYSSLWNSDSAKDSDADRDARLEQYTDVVNGYYDGATILYEYAWGDRFHFSRFRKGESFTASLSRHEHYLAKAMNLKPGMRVLDVGCGVGGPAREIAAFTDAHITGVNNNDYQLSRARAHTKKAGLEHLVDFRKGDFMNLSASFGENQFDAVYAIEATVHAPNFEGIYGEIFKVLKPGGTFGVYEWVMTDKWDPSNPEHKKIAHGIELGDGIPEMRNYENARNALKKVGFQIEHEEDLAERDDDLPWYYPLEGDIRKAQTAWDIFMCWRTSRMGIFFTQNGLWAMEKCRLVPKGTHAIGNDLATAAEALIAGGQTKLFTPMALWVCTKPKN
ncbi:putative secondary metabolism biosynthetic enzyme [Naganishia adeliensis]|uniref:Secondary metabolism biosynthetic enzyme n=1 Tax=Naganishia adeliensis TaxID=92952 RepID=A0ACC2WTF4_9TREE|nr:putative secondary metabolism biosynthetic enzyme [Naganishia adeliensis]